MAYNFSYKFEFIQNILKINKLLMLTLFISKPVPMELE